MISVVLTTVYPGRLADQLRSLARQTCQDFELVLVDAYYHARRTQLEDLVVRLGLEKRVRHFPSLEQLNIAKKYDYCPKNNAILLARFEQVLLLDDYEWYRPTMVETVVQSSTPYHYFYLNRLAGDALSPTGDSVDFHITGRRQTQDCEQVDDCPIVTAPDDEVDPLHVWNHCSFLRSRFLREFNGFDEAATAAHSWDDLEIGARMHKRGIRFQRHFQVLYHFEHSKAEVGLATPLPCCLPPGMSDRATYVEDYREWATAAPSVRVYVEHGHDWFRCGSCGFAGPTLGEAGFIAKTRLDSRVKAAVGWSGGFAGRNLAALSDDMVGLTEQGQVELLRSSYTCRRYYS